MISCDLSDEKVAISLMERNCLKAGEPSEECPKGQLNTCLSSKFSFTRESSTSTLRCKSRISCWSLQTIFEARLKGEKLISTLAIEVEG